MKTISLSVAFTKFSIPIISVTGTVAGIPPTCSAYSNTTVLQLYVGDAVNKVLHAGDTFFWIAVGV